MVKIEEEKFEVNCYSSSLKEDKPFNFGNDKIGGDNINGFNFDETPDKFQNQTQKKLESGFSEDFTINFSDNKKQQIDPQQA